MSERLPAHGMQRILLATDGSDHSGGAVAVAIEGAAKCGCQLFALTMVISNPELEALAPEVVAKAELRAREILDGVEAAAGARGMTIERLVRHGQDPAHQIVGQAEKRRADLIVMGRRGVRGLARMMVGEATVKVCASAPCNVLVVPSRGRLPQGRILLATDGSSYSDVAVDPVHRLAALSGLPVTVVSIILPEQDEGARADATQAVERLSAELSSRGIDAAGMTVEAERPETGILAIAAEIGADLIVVGSHGRSGLLEKVLIGSVSERVLGDAACPVLVVRAT